MAGQVFRDGVLEDPFLSPSGDAEWVSRVAGKAGNVGGSSQGRGGPGTGPARAFTSLHRNGDGFPPALSEEAKCRALRERVMLSRPWLEIP